MLKNFWYAIAWKDEVTESPKRFTCLGQELAMYRKADGEAVCFSDLCVHRGGSLSEGWVEDDCLVCPYHAWKYESGGSCVRIPASPEGSSIPKKARVDVYPVKEKYGWVWVFLGDLAEEDRPPIPDFGDVFNDPSFRKVRGEFLWNANYERIVENGCDVTHVNWVHSFGSKDQPEVRDLKVDIGEWSASATLTLEPTPSKGLWNKVYNKAENNVATTTTWYMPSIVRIHIRLPMGNMIIYDTNIPIDEHTTLTKWIGQRDFVTGKWADRDAIKRILNIFKQDQNVVERQRPELLPVDMAGELHHKTDACQVAYRKLRNKLLAQGWGIDTHKIRYGDNVATVIPSPARAESPELAHAWVMKEVPTTQPPPANVPEKAEEIGESQVDIAESEPSLSLDRT